MTDQGGLFDDMPIHVTDSPPPRGAAPGFYLDRHEARSILASVDAVRNQVNNTVTRARWLLRLNPPAADPTSRSFNTTIGGPGTGVFAVGVHQLDEQVRRLNGLHDALAKAIGLIEANDRHSGGVIAESGTI